jgi:hypothetical protein
MLCRLTLGGFVLGIAGLLASGARADDVRLLAGSGSFADAVKDDTRTLEGGKTDTDTLPVCYWKKLARWGYCAPVCSPVVCAAPAYYTAPAYYAPPAYYPPAPTAPPPAAGPATYYAPQAPEAVVVAPTRPQITVGYQGRFFGGSLAIPLGARLARMARPIDEPPVEVAPLPRSGGSYRYDGGPSQTVPMPTPDPNNPTDPVPTTVPALQKVMWERSRQRTSYPAYGEKPAKRPMASPPLLVKRADQ